MVAPFVDAQGADVDEALDPGTVAASEPGPSIHLYDGPVIDLERGVFALRA